MKKHGKLCIRIAVLLTISMLGACSSFFTETHYFKATDRRTNATINYYRLKVNGGSLFSSARYISGLFDADAVEVYFNEFSQPPNGQFIRSATRPASDGAAAASASSTDSNAGPGQEVSTLSGKSLEGKHLLLLFSTNSNEIAAQISNIATSQDIASNLVKLVSRDSIKAQGVANSDLGTLRARNGALAQLGANLLTIDAATGNLADASQDQVIQNLLAYANALASDLGNDTPFPTLDAAASWLQSHRASLLKGNP